VAPPAPSRSGTLTNTDDAPEKLVACVLTDTHSELPIATTPASSHVLVTLSFVMRFVTSDATNNEGATLG
jgi:hypothetical protein